MMKRLMLLLCLTSSSALAGPWVVGGSGGWDVSTSQPWLGVEAALPPSQRFGLAPIARGRLAWGFLEQNPLLTLDVGATVVVPAEGEAALVRAGIALRGITTLATHPLPLQLSNRITSIGQLHPGLIPGAYGLIEFEWGEEVPFTLGVRGGVVSSATSFLCPDGIVTDGCITWSTSFLGGFYLRTRLRNHLALEVLVGPGANLSIGRWF